MSVLMPWVKARFFDHSNPGKPLSGGKVYTYLAGTGLATPKATYTDSTETSSNTNPIILDSNGEANIWIGAGAYDIRLTDSAGVQQWVVYNVSGKVAFNSVNTMTELKALSPGQYSIVELLGYASAGDGGGGTFRWDSTSVASDTGTVIQPNSAPAAGRWVRIINDRWNVKWFGANGSGTGVDLTAVALATLALSSAGGGDLYFPPLAAGLYYTVSASYAYPTVRWQLDEAAVLNRQASGTLSLGVLFDAPRSNHFGANITSVAFPTPPLDGPFPEWYGAKGDGSTDDTAAFTKAIASALPLQCDARTYVWASQVTLDQSTGIIGKGEGQTIFSVTHTGTALRVATNNKPALRDFRIIRGTIGAVGSRTGIGLDVFGNIAGGSSVQAQVRNVWVEGFSIGLRMEGNFLSRFEDMTFKRVDQTYYFKNNTNDSIIISNCTSNNLIKQHMYANGGTQECGATFIGCEFEDAQYMPAFEVADAASGGYFQFRDCYSYENNAGTFAGSTDQLFLCSVPSHIQISGSGWNGGGKSNARVFYFRNTVASSLKYFVTILNTEIACDRGAGAGSAPVDMDGAILTDLAHKFFINGCRYNNTNGSPYPNICDREDTQYNQEFYGVMKALGLKLLNSSGSMKLDSDSTGNWRYLGHTYTGGHWVFNDGSQNQHFWLGSSGQLRSKSSAPTSQDDGDPACYIIPKLQGQVIARALTDAGATTNEWITTLGSNTGEVQVASAQAGALIKFGVDNSSGNFAYSSKNTSERSFIMSAFSPRLAIPYSQFTIAAVTYTVRHSDQDKIYVLEDNTSAAAASTLTGVKYVSARGWFSASALELETTDLIVRTVGKGLKLKEGTDAMLGTATLVAGTVTVATAKVTTNSRIFLTAQTSGGGTPGALRVSARVAGTSFTVTSTSGTDTSAFAWMIIEPSP